jgi:hypothetical protein
LENVSLRVPVSNLRDFSLFGVCPANKHCPSARCACATNAVGKDLDIFVIGAVSLNYICTQQPKIVNNICSSENGGATRDVSRRIQKARGAFAKMQKVWQCTLMNRDTNIKVFNACVKSVLSYGCEIRLATNVLRRIIQMFINRCLIYIYIYIYILRIWWPRTISNRELWQLSG